VSFSYDGGTSALRDVTFDVGAGEHVAIVGPSGAGKSTLTNVLLGFVRAEAGRIIAAGEPLAELELADWRRHIAWVPQRAHLFAGTVAENIALGLAEPKRAAIVEAAEKAHARGFVETLPNGFNTPLGEDGAGLSGGEIQRIALARAFLRDAPLVILDEPTASLDAVSEAAIVEAIEVLGRGRTVLSIAHRLHTVRRADRIVMLDRGRVVASGSHTALANTDGPYRKLLDATLPAGASA